ncbi:MAG: hypothetical protein Q9191_005107 [Dirinaria sp. TL-2023a]
MSTHTNPTPPQGNSVELAVLKYKLERETRRANRAEEGAKRFEEDLRALESDHERLVSQGALSSERITELEIERDQAVAEKEKALVEKEKTIADKESAIAEKESALAEKESALPSLRKENGEPRAKLTRFQETSLTIERRLKQKSASVSQALDHMKALVGHMNALGPHFLTIQDQERDIISHLHRMHGAASDLDWANDQEGNTSSPPNNPETNLPADVDRDNEQVFGSGGPMMDDDHTTPAASLPHIQDLSLSAKDGKRPAADPPGPKGGNVNKKQRMEQGSKKSEELAKEKPTFAEALQQRPKKPTPFSILSVKLTPEDIERRNRIREFLRKREEGPIFPDDEETADTQPQQPESEQQVQSIVEQEPITAAQTSSQQSPRDQGSHPTGGSEQ